MLIDIRKHQVNLVFLTLIGILLLSTGAFAQTTDESLVGWWKFDETYGTTLVDSSGHGNHGTISGATLASGKFDGALYFDGDHDYVDLPAAAFSTLDDQLTISFWAFGGDTLPKNTVLFQANDSSNNRVLNCHLPYVNSGVANIQFDAGQGESQGDDYDKIKKNAETVDDYKGRWNLWAFTKDASSGQMKIYLNGRLWHSESGKTMRMSGISVFRIGGRVSDGTVNYEGLVDDFRLFNRALSENEIKTMVGLEVHCSPAGGDLNGDCIVDMNDIKQLAQIWLLSDSIVQATPPDDSRLQVFYMFDESSGTVAGDSSGKNRDAVIEAVDIDTAWTLAGYSDQGSAMNLDGNCQVVIPSEVFGSITDQFTVSAWLNTGDSKINAVDFGAGPTDPNLWDKVDWMTGGDDDPNGWVNFAFVKDAGESVMRIYRSGLIIAHDGNALQSINGPEAGLTYLGSTCEQGGCFKGVVDNLRIYDYALSQSQIVYLAAAGQVQQPISPYLVSYEPQEDGIINFCDFSVLANQWLQDLTSP